VSEIAEPIPCPFCGGSGLKYIPYDLKAYDHPPLVVDGPLNVCVTGEGWYCVQCVDCYAMGPRVKATKAQAVTKAIDAWNGRTLWA
jgi:hypothetical protein